MNVMGPLARVWKALEDVKNDLTLTLSLEEVATNTDKTVLFLGRHSNSDLLPSVQCSLLSHKRSLKTQIDF